MGASCLALATRSARRGRAGVQLGMLNEQRALKAAQRLPAWWFLSARLTKHGSVEDRLGVDLVIETLHRGTIRIQVKSSAERARRFRAHGRTLALRWRIHTLVVTELMTPEEVLGHVFGVCILAIEEADRAGSRLTTHGSARRCLRGTKPSPPPERPRAATCGDRGDT